MGKANASLLQSQEITGLKAELTGAMGKRTKFQTKSTPQLILDATSSKDIYMKIGENNNNNNNNNNGSDGNKGNVPSETKHFEDSPLLEVTKLDEDDNEEKDVDGDNSDNNNEKKKGKNQLTLLDQEILIAKW